MEQFFLEEISELISRYGLEEDGENIIIPYTDKNGRQKRCFILKRNYIRITYSEDHYIDYPLKDIIEAIVGNPELPLSESLYLLQAGRDAHKPEGAEEKKDNGEK